jgi:hypothetical protein
MYHDKNPKLLFLQRLRDKDPSAFVPRVVVEVVVVSFGGGGGGGYLLCN